MTEIQCNNWGPCRHTLLSKLSVVCSLVLEWCHLLPFLLLLLWCSLLVTWLLLFLSGGSLTIPHSPLALHAHTRRLTLTHGQIKPKNHLIVNSTAHQFSYRAFFLSSWFYKLDLFFDWVNTLSGYKGLSLSHRGFPHWWWFRGGGVMYCQHLVSVHAYRFHKLQQARTIM